jgi:hypothetical protein
MASANQVRPLRYFIALYEPEVARAVRPFFKRSERVNHLGLGRHTLRVSSEPSNQQYRFSGKRLLSISLSGVSGRRSDS